VSSLAASGVLERSVEQRGGRAAITGARGIAWNLLC
jgi:hypothetical protein